MATKDNGEMVAFSDAENSRIEGDIIRIAGRIETIIGDREAQTKFVKDNWEDSESGEAYSKVEQDWIDAAGDTLMLVNQARKLLGENSVIAKDHSGKVLSNWA